MEFTENKRDSSLEAGYGEEYHKDELNKFLQIFLRRWKLFTAVALTLFILTSAMWLSRAYSPNYEATFDLGVSNGRQVDGMFSDLKESFPNQINSVTQGVISNLLSVNIAQGVVDSLSLFVATKEKNADFSVETRVVRTFESPLGPYRLRFGRETFALYDEEGNRLMEGRLGEFESLGPVEVRIAPIVPISPDAVFSLTIYSPQKTALALRNSISIKILGEDRIDKGIAQSGIPFSGEGSARSLVTSSKNFFSGLGELGILRISVFWGNPYDALRIAQSLSKEIIRENIGEKSVQFIQSRGFIENQLAFYEEKLTQIEDTIKNFKESKRITNLTASTQAKITQISTIETRSSQLYIEETMLKNLSRYLVSNVETSGTADSSFRIAPTLLSTPVLQSLYSAMLQTEADLRGRLKSYSPGHPKIFEVKAKLAGLKDQLKEEASKRLVTLKTEIRSVKSEIESLEKSLESVPADEIALARLARDRETAEKLYTLFAGKLEETRVQEAAITSDLKVINPPVVSSEPVYSRNPWRTLMLALLFSILLGAVVVYAVEFFDRTVKDIDLLKEKVNLPIFAAIPAFNGKDKRKKFHTFPTHRKSIQNSHRSSVTDDLASPEFEAFRKLAVNLSFAHPQKKYRIIYITSPGPEEGKTFLTLNLGTVLSVTGKKVLVIDTDFRKGRGHLTDVTSHKKEVGLFEVLEGKVHLKDVIIRSRERKPDLVPIGTIPPNPFIFLQSERMKIILDTLKTEYDHILIDGLPVLLFADATYLAAASDGVLIGCRYGQTTYKRLEESHSILKTSKTDIVGLVVNFVPCSRGSYYYYYYYKYYNKYYKSDGTMRNVGPQNQPAVG